MTRTADLIHDWNQTGGTFRPTRPLQFDDETLRDGLQSPAVSDPHKCLEWAGTLNLRQSLTFHPASQFWPLQWVETGIFVGLAGLLVGFSFWWLRRRAS